MTAAALSRSRQVVGVRTTKHLFFIFTLLSLVFLTNSLIGKEELKNVKERVQKLQQQIDRWKAQRAASSENMNYYANLMAPLKALMKKASKGLPKDFPPLEELMQSVMDFAEKSMNYVNGQNKELDEEIQNKEQKLREVKELIKFVEEQQAEL